MFHNTQQFHALIILNRLYIHSKVLYDYCFAKGKVFIICMPYGILTLLNVYNSLSNIGKLFGEY